MIKLSLLLIPITISCSLNKGNVGKTGAKLIFEKTTCMGPCPAYKFATNTKTANLTVVANYDLAQGSYKATLNKEQRNRIEEIMNNEDMWKGRATYGQMYLPDLATTHITLTQGEKTRKLTMYGQVPDQLSSSLEKLEDIIQSLSWEKEVMD